MAGSFLQSGDFCLCNITPCLEQKAREPPPAKRLPSTHQAILLWHQPDFDLWDTNRGQTCWSGRSSVLRLTTSSLAGVGFGCGDILAAVWVEHARNFRWKTITTTCWSLFFRQSNNLFFKFYFRNRILLPPSPHRHQISPGS